MAIQAGFAGQSETDAYREVRASCDPKAFNDRGWSAMADTGWGGVILPAEHGGD